MCTRVICKDHIPLPLGSNVEKAVFICIACHIRVFSGPTPYFVSVFSDITVHPSCRLTGILQRCFQFRPQVLETSAKQTSGDPG